MQNDWHSHTQFWLIYTQDNCDTVMYMTTSHYFIFNSCFKHACTFHWVHVCAHSGLIIFMHVNVLEVSNSVFFPGSLL